MKCQDCGTEMVLMITSSFCPKDCDRKGQITGQLTGGLIALYDNKKIIPYLKSMTLPHNVDENFDRFAGQFDTVDDEIFDLRMEQ